LADRLAAPAARRARLGRRLVLYDPAGFEPLTDEPWDDERVRAAIRAIVADVDAAFDPVGLWPANEWDAWGSTPPLKDLYCGAAGVILGARRAGPPRVRRDGDRPRCRGRAHTRALARSAGPRTRRDRATDGARVVAPVRGD